MNFIASYSNKYKLLELRFITLAISIGSNTRDSAPGVKISSGSSNMLPPFIVNAMTP